MQAFKTVDQAASDAVAMLADGERLSRLWRYVFVQMLDDYTSVLRHAGVPAAARMWASPPRSTGGLAEDWLNDAVKGFLPGPDPDAQCFYSSDSLIVDVASPRYLLAMKLFA